jgi:hypothetical protein
VHTGKGCNRKKQGAFLKQINGYLCFLDVMGFRDQYNLPEFEKRYEKLEKYIRGNEILDAQDYYLYLMSDSIIIISSELETIIHSSLDLYSFGLKEGIWLRGGISKGKINIYSDVKINNHIIFPCLGEAYLKAYDLEQQLNCVAINIDNDLSEEIEESLLIKYEEWFTKPGTPREKKILVRDLKNNWGIILTHFANLYRKPLDALPLEIEKYINTFCLYMKILIKELYKKPSDLDEYFLKHICGILEEHGYKVVFPNEFIIVFIAFIEELRANHDLTDEVSRLIRKVITILREKGFLSVFLDYLKTFNKKSLIAYINSALSE